MTQQPINVTPDDLMSTIRDLQADLTNIRLIASSLRRQLVETQAEHAKCPKQEKEKADAPEARKE